MRIVKFLKQVLWDYEESHRQTGRTKWMLDQAKKTGATIVTHPFHAKELVEQGYRAISLKDFLDPNYHKLRYPQTFSFDSSTEVQIVQMKLKEAEELLKGNVR